MTFANGIPYVHKHKTIKNDEPFQPQCIAAKINRAKRKQG